MKQSNFLNEWIRCGALCSKGNERLFIGWGARKWTAEPCPGRPNFYFPDFFLENPTPWFQHDHYLEISIQDLLSAVSKNPLSFHQKYEWKNLYRDFFYGAFDELKRAIHSGKLIKAVPFVMESAEKSMGEARLQSSLKNVLEYALKNPVHPYGFWGEGQGILGASPEILFHNDGKGTVETMACAGTLNAKEDPQSFLSDAKELHEHELVIRGIEESFRPYGNVALGELQLLKLPRLIHLVTPLRIQLHAELPFEKIVEAIHPTPAVGAFPKDRGSPWLRNFEQKLNRRRFGAPAGFYSPEEKQSYCYVAIRNVQWEKERMCIAAGCGIVAESQCDKEWNEIQLKIRAIKEMFDL